MSLINLFFSIQTIIAGKISDINKAHIFFSRLAYDTVFETPVLDVYGARKLIFDDGSYPELTGYAQKDPVSQNNRFLLTLLRIVVFEFIFLEVDQVLKIHAMH